jgi:Cu-Zn family superoxide dismutase
MVRPALPVGLTLVSALFAFGSLTTAAGPLEAKADISGEGIKGKVEFKEVPAQSDGHMDMTFLTGTMAVQITVSVTGLKAGAHGIHLHAVGKCESPFTSAGGHFDPGPASNPDPDANHPFHMGDLPNLVADAAGKATMKTVTNRITLRDGPLSVFDADGTAVIIHGNPDEGITAESKAGKSGGPRLACGVIEKD